MEEPRLREREEMEWGVTAEKNYSLIGRDCEPGRSVLSQLSGQDLYGLTNLKSQIVPHF